MTNSFGRIIKRLRNKAALTQQEVANLVIVSHSYIQKIEIGKEIPCAAVIHKLADILDYDAKVLLKVARDIKVDRYIKLINERYI